MQGSSLIRTSQASHFFKKEPHLEALSRETLDSIICYFDCHMLSSTKCTSMTLFGKLKTEELEEVSKGICHSVEINEDEAESDPKKSTGKNAGSFAVSELILSNVSFSDFSDESIIDNALKYGYVRLLKIDGCDTLNEKGFWYLSKILERYQNLKGLDFEIGSDTVDEGNGRSAVQSCKELYFKKICEVIGQRLTRLEVLTLSAYVAIDFNLSKQGLALIMQGVPLLNKLTLSSLGTIRGPLLFSEFFSSLNGFKALESLTFQGCLFEAEGAQDVAGLFPEGSLGVFACLRKVSFGKPVIDDEPSEEDIGFEEGSDFEEDVGGGESDINESNFVPESAINMIIANTPNLQELHIAEYVRFTDGLFHGYQGNTLPFLKELSVTTTDALIPALLSSLQRCGNLTQLKLQWEEGFPFASSVAHQALALKVASVRTLQLVFPFSCISLFQLFYVFKLFPNVEYLKIISAERNSSGQGQTPYTVSSIPQHSSLRRIDLSHSKRVNLEMLQNVVRACPQLEKIQLNLENTGRFQEELGDYF